MQNDMYLTEEQYLSILRKIKETISEEGFTVYCWNSTTVGNKFTESNCGFCNDAYIDKDMALFPHQFPERKTMKYRGENHKCPFDARKKPGILGWGYGCFDECYLFKHLGKRDWGLPLMREMVDSLIRQKEKQLIKT